MDALLDWTELHYGSLPAEVASDQEARVYAADILRADFRMLESRTLMRPDIRMSCPITVFGGRDDVIATVAELMTWRKHGTMFRLRLFPGGHDFIRQSPSAVANAVASEMRQVFD